MSGPTSIESARFPRVALMLQMTAVAEVLRSAADALDALAAEAPLFEIGTLRSKARGIVLSAIAFADGATAEDA